MRKRIFDLVISVAAGIIALPIILLSAGAAAIALRTARPFFVQTRIGLEGREFRFVKIRTLPVTFPPMADKYAVQYADVPKLCRFLRATHLDELPQLFLVISGKMSLVGPRPEMPSLLFTFDQRFVAARARVRPGCTGLWQISESVGGLIGEAPEYDLYYLANGGLRFDAWILLRTIHNFLAGGRLVTLDAIPDFARSRGLVDDVEIDELLRESLPAVV